MQGNQVLKGKKVDKKTVDNRKVPAIFRPHLWSYDIKKMNLDTNKKTIIMDVLIHGHFKAWKELYKIYGQTQIKNVFLKARVDTWNAQAYNFWKMKFA